MNVYGWSEMKDTRARDILRDKQLEEDHLQSVFCQLRPDPIVSQHLTKHDIAPLVLEQRSVHKRTCHCQHDTRAWVKADRDADEPLLCVQERHVENKMRHRVEA